MCRYYLFLYRFDIALPLYWHSGDLESNTPKPFKYWWIIPYSLLYLLSAQMLTFTAYIAYDDPADPNYMHYKDWELKDFILSDIKRLVIWLFIGVILFLILKKGTKKINLALRCIIGILAVLAVLALILGFTV